MNLLRRRVFAVHHQVSVRNVLAIIHVRGRIVNAVFIPHCDGLEPVLVLKCLCGMDLLIKTSRLSAMIPARCLHHGTHAHCPTDFHNPDLLLLLDYRLRKVAERTIC